MVRPPQKGEASYETYEAEKGAILGSLRRRAELLSNSLNAMEGVTCNAIDGALYAFPTIRLPGMSTFPACLLACSLTHLSLCLDSREAAHAYTAWLFPTVSSSFTVVTLLDDMTLTMHTRRESSTSS